MTAERPSVCFVSRELYNYLFPEGRDRAGGAERQQSLIGRELADRGYDVSAITGRFDDTRHETVDGIDVRTALPPDLPGTLLGVPARTLGLFRAMRAADADTYYVRGSQFLLCLTALCVAPLDARVVFAVANDTDVDPAALAQRQWLQRRCYRLALRRVSVVAQTTHQQTMLHSEFGVTAPVVPAGYELPPASALLPAGEREFVLWVGRLQRDQKHPERFLDLADALPDRAFVLVATPGRDTAYNQSIRERAADADNVAFEGYVPPDEVHEFYRRAAVVVNTSDTEGFGNVFLEAWRFGTPVVSLYHTLDGIIPEREVGRHSGSMSQLAADVDALAGDPTLRERLGTAGRDLVRDRFELGAVVDELEPILEGRDGR